MKVNSHIKNIEFNLGQKRGFERKKQRARDKGQGTNDIQGLLFQDSKFNISKLVIFNPAFPHP